MNEERAFVDSLVQASTFSFLSSFFVLSFSAFPGLFAHFFHVFVFKNHAYVPKKRKQTEISFSFFARKMSVLCCFPTTGIGHSATADSGACRGRDVLPEPITCVHSPMHSHMAPRPAFSIIIFIAALSSCDLVCSFGGPDRVTVKM